MDFGDLAKLIVPGIVLVFWALNQLFGKEDAAAPNRNPQLGPKPSNLPPAPRPRPRPGEPAPAATTPKSWSNGFDPVRTPASAAKPAGHEDVFIIGPDAGRPGSKRPGGGGGGRRSGRGKAAPTPERRVEPPRSKALVDPLDQTLTVSPLSIPGGGRLTDQAPMRPESGREAAAIDLSGAFNSPERLREAILLQVVLGPPKALQIRRPR